MASFQASIYQEAIFRFIKESGGSAQVGAVAGSGKTTTLVEGARYLNGSSSVFVAFNKHIAEHLKTKLGGGCEARTLHSIGYETVRAHLGYQVQLDGKKYWDAYSDHRRELKPEDYSELPKLCDFARLTCTEPDERSLMALARDYSLAYSPAMAAPVASILEWGVEEARRGRIDYNDMIWLPSKLSLDPSRRFSFVLADEAQDFNVAQRNLVLSLLSSSGRLIAVGDENQAIMQFAGADELSWREIGNVTNATLLPLSICYRCPTSHIEMAREIVPWIEAREDAPRGIVAWIGKEDVEELAGEGDLIVCRRTAPLIGLCFRLIASGVNARVRGRDIGKGLAKVIRKIGKTPAAWNNFETQVQKWLEGEINKVTLRNGSDDHIRTLRDQAECMVICKRSYKAESAALLGDMVETLFSEDSAPIVLSTVHRAKGLEADRVFILEPEKLGTPWKESERQAEMNLKYVALTRAREALYFVGSGSTLFPSELGGS